MIETFENLYTFVIYLGFFVIIWCTVTVLIVVTLEKKIWGFKERISELEKQELKDIFDREI